MKSSPILRRWKTVDKNGRPAAKSLFPDHRKTGFFLHLSNHFQKNQNMVHFFLGYLEGRGIIIEHTVYNSHDGPRLSAFSLYGMECGR